MLAARLAAMAAARGGEVSRADALLGRGLIYYSPSSLRTTWVANATSSVPGLNKPAETEMTTPEAIGDNEGHPFLLVDFAKRKEHPSMFRRRLNEFMHRRARSAPMKSVE